MTNINELFKSRQVILDMLKVQGYDISDYEGVSLSEVSTMRETDQMDMLLTKKDNPKKCYVKYHFSKTTGKDLGLVKIDHIESYKEDLMSSDKNFNNSDDLMVISKDEPNDTLMKELKKLWEQERVFVVVFSIKRLQYNILEHNLVPQHTIMTQSEVVEFKDKYKITDDKQIPDIGRFSPVALAIGMRPGDICKIIRSSRIAIETPFYRVCV